MDDITKVIIKEIDKHFIIETENQPKLHNTINYITEIKQQCDYFILTHALTPMDIDFFIMNYIKYINMIYDENLENIIVPVFNALMNNIKITIDLIDNPKVKFLIGKDQQYFKRGFLI